MLQNLSNALNLVLPIKGSFFFHRFGYGDASFSVYEKMVHRPFNWANSIFRVGSSNFGEQSRSSFKIHEPKEDEFLSFGPHESLCTRTATRLSHVGLTPSSSTHVQKPRSQDNLIMPFNKIANPPELKTLKRKASGTEIDLDLSLKLNSKIDGEGRLEDHNEVGSNLSLSLHPQSSSSNVSSRMKEAQNRCKEQRKMASTLDLTI